MQLSRSLISNVLKSNAKQQSSKLNSNLHIATINNKKSIHFSKTQSTITKQQPQRKSTSELQFQFQQKQKINREIPNQNATTTNSRNNGLYYLFGGSLALFALISNSKEENENFIFAKEKETNTNQNQTNINAKKLTPAEIAKTVEHTLLKADATPQQIRQLCDEAKKYSFGAVCVNSTHTKLVADQLRGTGIETCVVVGFPLGASSKNVKVFEAVWAVQEGADSVDMVLNIGDAKEKHYEKIADEISSVVKAVKVAKPTATVKLILETCLLTNEEKEEISTLAAKFGIDYVKTSTGFSTGGATIADVTLMKKAISSFPNVKVKASGGIRDLETALAMIEAGANRLGTSSGVKIVDSARNPNPSNQSKPSSTSNY